jgi:[acyl-carrier-protein] S-malonyltransferase
MVSILGLGLEDVEDICNASGVEIANLNCPNQVVVSGGLKATEKAIILAKEKNAKVVMLDVSGPFHSSLMAEASHKLAKALKDVQILPPKISVISNVSAYSQDDPRQIKENLIDQVSSATHWEESIRNVVSRGINTFLEIGPGTVLKGLLRRIDPKLICNNIQA